jgi:hypothetical protein
MQPDFHEQLCSLLVGGPINDKAKVVYLLVEARQLLAHEKTLKQTMQTLEFYCNWGLHAQLNSAGAPQHRSDIESDTPRRIEQ